MEGIECLVTLLVLLVIRTSGLPESMGEWRTHRGSLEHSWSAGQGFAVSDEFWGDTLPAETSVLNEDPIPEDPSDHGEIDDAEFLSKKVWTTDLVGVALEVFNPLCEGGGLKLRCLSVEHAEVAGYYELVDKIYPDPGLSSLIGVCRSQVGFAIGVSIFEELEDNVRVVERSSLVRESGDQSFGIESFER